MILDVILPLVCATSRELEVPLSNMRSQNKKKLIKTIKILKLFKFA